MEINYLNEHPFPGQLGNFFTVLSFVSAIVAGISYVILSQTRDNSWRLWARTGFFIHSFSVLAVIGILFYLIGNHYFEYDYVWKHSNRQMPLRYIFACFWEGQEGSFLLWMFWHILLGIILIRKSRDWEPQVMAVVALVQVFLASMLLGIYVGDHKIGSNPFLLIRELPENIGLPWTLLPDYLTRIPQFADGRGLNPLLQNYWMTIHPPTLFLGFALTLVPFAYAIAGLWKNNLQGWLQPALPWTFAGVLVLGTGILMGGAWAYEALSFGGFWAWDPVENASLVPWLTLVGAGHLILINRKQASSLFTAFFLSLISFILVLYSTFLTRSGVLGDTSVHSFTDNGMTGQLLLYLLCFAALATGLLIRQQKERLLYWVLSIILLICMALLREPVYPLVFFLLVTAVWLVRAYGKLLPAPQAEEKLWSREFWVFVGSLVLMLSALQITFSTSTPVINMLLKPFGPVFTALHESTGWDGLKKLAAANIAPPVDAIRHYNQWQIPFAFLTALLVAVGQYFAYRQTNMQLFWRRLVVSFGISLLITALLTWLLEFNTSQVSLILLLFASIFAVSANVAYFVAITRGRWKFSGSSVAHTGFGLILLGALISTGKIEKISENRTTFDITALGEDFSNNEDILLFRGDTVALGDYFISYREKSLEGVNQFYHIDYFSQQPNFYKKGDLIISKGMIFRARNNHVPGTDFLKDQPLHWEMVEHPTPVELRFVKLWNPYRAGEKVFTLQPRIQLNPKFGNVPEPDTRHYLTKDIYTHVRWAEISDRKSDSEGYFEPVEHKARVGDTIFSARGLIIVEQFAGVRDKARHRLLESDFAAAAHLRILTGDGREYHAEPLVIIRDNDLPVPDIATVEEAGIKVSISDLDPESRQITFQVAEHEDNAREFIVMQAIVFPGINILWTGCLLMAIGTFIAIVQRIRLRKPVIKEQ